MDKEILTEKYLKGILRTDALIVLAIIPIFLLMLWPVTYMCSLADWTKFSLAYIFLVLTELLLLGVLVYLVYTFVYLMVCIHRKPIVLVDKRIVAPVGEKEVIYREKRSDLYIMTFRDNGRFANASKFTWESTFPGDMFYLLMRKPGRILYAFPCNNYEYEGQISELVYVNGKPEIRPITETTETGT